MKEAWTFFFSLPFVLALEEGNIHHVELKEDWMMRADPANFVPAERKQRARWWQPSGRRRPLARPTDEGIKFLRPLLFFSFFFSKAQKDSQRPIFLLPLSLDCIDTTEHFFCSFLQRRSLVEAIAFFSALLAAIANRVAFNFEAAAASTDVTHSRTPSHEGEHITLGGKWRKRKWDLSRFISFQFNESV